MTALLSENMLWIKSLHIISVIAWMAGMMYLPRLFVYHCGADPGSVQSETFKLMERRLLRGIINPAMIASILFGAMLLLVPGLIDWTAIWIWLKLALVLGLAGMHGLFSRWRGQFEADQNAHPAAFYRIVNEIPFVIMGIIVFLVVLRPF